ncbi:hypothetical protein [Streptomyces sp. XD-27]|uniref:hypothetical protein n=1 Tax=Streptomyces sp. XD-27 TaxID=3062779 RepID=UPI0026F433F9|nr:hypothetical protein [Streptomyces sp. XD-27]WKX73968.1 hypothetical protein Q3Y56_32530 [Streptomyces sp. XD-27]
MRASGKPRRRRSGSRRWLVCVAAIGLTATLSGCLGGDNDDNGDNEDNNEASASFGPGWDRQAEPGTRHDVGGDGMPRFRLTLPDGVRIEEGYPPVAASGTPSECRMPPQRVADEDNVYYSWFSVPTSCTADREANENPHNGMHPRYRSTADIPPSVNKTARTVRTPLGPARVFTQKFWKATNEYHSFYEPFVVITLDRPADPKHPTLVFTSEEAEISESDLVRVVTKDLAPR